MIKDQNVLARKGDKCLKIKMFYQGRWINDKRSKCSIREGG